MWVVLLLLPAACLGTSKPHLDPPTAQFPQGTMVGTKATTRGGRSIEAYLGIPFATAPVGPLRFKPPRPPPKWEGVFNATQQKDQCVQALTPIGSEDCLYLNVYTPKATPEPKLAVMVFIFGGGYEIGTTLSLLYGPDYFLDEDIVLVTINYRLGVLGFLSLEDPVLPGNLGLKDQRAALRWIKQNILYFGGDPRRITLFGQSAGAASVHYHTKFSSHEGLFRGAILQSGSSFDCWAFQPPGSHEMYVRYIAAKTGCNSNDPPAALVECLRGVDAVYFGEILTEMFVNLDPLERKITLLTPIIEPPGTEDPFITADPWTVPTSTPMMAGVTDKECLSLNLPPILDQDQSNSLFARLDANFTHYLPINLQFNFSAEDPNLVSNLLKEFYLGDKQFARTNYPEIVDLYSDGSIVSGVFRAARSNRQKTYFYYFTYMGLYTTTYLVGSPSRIGVAHADDLFFFFTTASLPDPVPSDLALSKQLVKMWTSFATCLDPTPGDAGVQWEPVSTPNIEYLHIGQTGLTMEKDFLKSRMDFWDELPFRNKPFEFKLDTIGKNSKTPDQMCNPQSLLISSASTSIINGPSTPSRAMSVRKITEKYLGNRQGQQESHSGASF